MAEQENRIPQSMGYFSPGTIRDLEELHGIRAEEFFRGIAPTVANRLYGPRTRISPQDAAELKVDLAKTYKDLAKVSQDGENASASDRVKLAIAAMQAGARTEAAGIAARGAMARTEMAGEYNLALQNLRQADGALDALGPVSQADRSAAANVGAVLNATQQLQELDRADLFNLQAGASRRGQAAGLPVAQAAAYQNFRRAVAADNDPDRVARLTVEIANRNGTTPERVKNFFLQYAGADTDNRENQAIIQAFQGDESTAAMEAMASYERSNQAAYNAMQAAGRRPGGSGAQAFLNVGLAAIEPGPGGVQVDNQTLQSLGVTAEQLQDPNAAQDIQTAAQAQIENLFRAIDEGAAATPYMQEKIDSIKQSAAIEGSPFRQFLSDAGLDPDSPAAIDVGFQLLEDEYAEVRRYETREAKLRAQAIRRQRRQQRMNQRQRAAEGELAAGTVQAAPGPMVPIDQELEMMERQALERQAAPQQEELTPEQKVQLLEQEGILLPGTRIIPLGKLEGDTQYEYAYDDETKEFIGFSPGQDPRTGNRFTLEGSGLASSNPQLTRSLHLGAQGKINTAAELLGSAPSQQEAGTEGEEAQGRDPGTQREGIGVRESQTENMQTIEKRLRAAARAARKRGNEASADQLEDEADRYLTLESGVTYRDEEARVRGVGTGFEQEEMLPGDETRTLEEAIPEDEPWQTVHTRLRPQPLEPIEDLLRTNEEWAETMVPPEFEGQVGTEETLSDFERMRSQSGLPAGFIPQTIKPEIKSTEALRSGARKRLTELQQQRGTPLTEEQQQRQSGTP